MTIWSLAMEPTLDDLLTDDVLQQAVRSAGLTPKEFKERLRDVAVRRSQMRGLGPE